MTIYAKKLTYKLGEVIQSITLYTAAEMALPNRLAIQDGSTTVYAAVGDLSDTNASRLRVRLGTTTKAVLFNSTIEGDATMLDKAALGEYDLKIAYENIAETIPEVIDAVKSNNASLSIDYEDVSEVVSITTDTWDTSSTELNMTFGNLKVSPDDVIDEITSSDISVSIATEPLGIVLTEEDSAAYANTNISVKFGNISNVLSDRHDTHVSDGLSVNIQHENISQITNVISDSHTDSKVSLGIEFEHKAIVIE